MFNNLPFRTCRTNRGPVLRSLHGEEGNEKSQIMQNKPNLQDSNMNVSAYKTVHYENLRPYSRRKNKPNQTQYWLCSGFGGSPRLRVEMILSITSTSAAATFNLNKNLSS